MDFLAIPPIADINRLILIEVKDFRGYPVANRKRQTSGDLVKEVVAKCLHSLSALFLACYRKDAELCDFGEHPLNPIGCHDSLPQRKIDLILLMEEDVVPATKKLELGNQKTRIQDMNLKLKRIHTNVNVSARVINSSSVSDRDGWSVTHL